MFQISVALFWSWCFSSWLIVDFDIISLCVKLNKKKGQFYQRAPDKSRKSKERKMTSIQDFTFLYNASAIQRALLISLQKEVEKFCSFPPKECKTRIAIKGRGRSNICVYELKKAMEGIEISFNLYKSEFSDTRDMVVDTEYIGTRGKRSSVFLTKLEDVEYVANLIKQSYEKNR